MTQSAENKIINYLKYRPKGKIYFLDDFSLLSNSESIRKSLSVLAKKGIRIRLTQGIYLYPKIDKEFGVLFPSIDDVCHEIVRRDKARIEPNGIFVINRLGLSTQVPMNVVYLTDGIPRKINYRNRITKYKKTAPKNLSMKGEISCLVVFALKVIGENGVTDEMKLQLSQVLMRENLSNIRHDALLAPKWVSELMQSLNRYL